jgi:DNA-binding winged helix-turn-helix (wHTH) protein/tetratricopeptide (TPR) repeat protein
MALKTQTSATLRFGTFEVDVRSRELHKQGKRIKLQDQPFQVLIVLLQRPGELINREELRGQIWPQDTFVDFDNNLNTAVNKLREALGDSADNPRFIETLPRRGYRFIAPVSGDQQEPSPATATKWKIVLSVAVIAVVAVAVAGGLLWRSRQSHRLTGKDTIVLADFTNTTGDPVFDGTLREGLSVQLEQSPFLSLVSDEGIHQTLRLMAQPANARLTPEMAREVCRRMNSAVAIDGSIAQIGSRYDLILRAVRCANGDSLASAEAQANDKNHVLDALQNTSAEMRKKLGESSNTVQRYNAALEQVTTPSLDALQAYTLGFQALVNGDPSAAVPSLQRAISLDPNFAMAYAALGTAYGGLGKDKLANENTKKAYDLRERVSEREKLYISSHYEEDVTGNMAKAVELYELWSQTYPRDVVPLARLGFYYSGLGQHDKALAEGRRALELSPDRGVPYEILAAAYLDLNRFDEAAAVIKLAKERGLDSPPINADAYALAFLRGDTAAMAREATWATGRPGLEDLFLDMGSDTAAYSGQVAQANVMTMRAVALARQEGESETAAEYLAKAALREALVGNLAEARRRASSAWQANSGDTAAALALALAGDLARAQKFSEDLARRSPQDAVFLPTIRAVVELAQKSPEKAIADLQAASPYELGAVGDLTLYPAYVRGQAYLAAGQGMEAAAEFQKILDHPGLALNEIIVPLAHLGLGRARVLSGDVPGARKAYQDFLALWQHADPDLPVLRQAKGEFARLQ